VKRPLLRSSTFIRRAKGVLKKHLTLSMGKEIDSARFRLMHATEN
jgi:hypothetical protein